MTAKELIQKLQDACGDNLERELKFQGTIELAVQDDWKSFPVTYNDCSVLSNHPNLVKIILEEQ